MLNLMLCTINVCEDEGDSNQVGVDQAVKALWAQTSRNQAQSQHLR